MDAFLSQSLGPLTMLQVAILTGLLFGSLIAEVIFKRILFAWIQKKFLAEKLDLSERKRNQLGRPFRILVVTFIWKFGLSFAHLPENWETNILKVIGLISAIGLLWLGHYAVEIVTHYFQQLADRSENKFDDILVPMLNRAAQFLVYCLGLLYIANSLSIEVSNILAGLGIGGLAFALAAKDTLSNFFGSLMIVMDRPFEIGDWVTIGGDIEGNVAKVGFRTTRIRTFYDSIISVPNSHVSNTQVDNYGKRRYRRYSTKINIEYDTSIEKIEAFCEGIRHLILEHPATRKDYFNVYLTDMAATSLDILLYVFWQVGDYSEELNQRHRLLVDIIRLARRLEVNFAFPTQTIHMFQHQNSELQNPTQELPLDDVLNKGREVSLDLLKRPLTPSKSRSSMAFKPFDTPR